MDSLKSNGTDVATVQMPSNGHSRSLSSNGDDQASITNLRDDKAPSKFIPERSNAMKFLLENILTIATLLGVVVGIGLGFGLKSAKKWTKRDIMYVNFPGEIFLNMLQCLILPLIVSSLIAAIGNLDMRLTGKIGLRSVVYYLSTTVLAIILGIILVMSIKPGSKKMHVKYEKEIAKPTLTEDTLMDLVRNMFPPNIIQACVEQYSTALKVPKVTNRTGNETVNMREWEFEGSWANRTNIMGIVVCSLVFAIALAKMGKQARPVLDIFDVLCDCIMFITKGVIWGSPVGVFFLVTAKILEMDDLTKLASQVGLYAMTVLVGLLVHGLIVLPMIFFAMTRKNPLKFMVNMGQALATAFGTSSSSATLPVTIACLEDKNKIDSRVARFVLPIGATINMDGTALYEAVAAIFIAQTRGISLTVGNIFAISITATAASVGAAGIPQAGLITMVMVLSVVGLPAEDVSLVLIVDWLLDRFRTTINVLGDAFGAGIIAHYSQKDLEEMSSEELNLEMTTL